MGSTACSPLRYSNRPKADRFFRSLPQDTVQTIFVVKRRYGTRNPDTGETVVSERLVDKVEEDL
jgi:hypothetical protein